MKMRNVFLRVGGELFEFYPKPEHGAYYQVGTNGEIGALYIPMCADGHPDFENVGEIEIEWENA